MLWRMSSRLPSRSGRGCRAEARKAKAGIVSARTARPVTLAPGGSASCPVIASGKRPANGAAGSAASLIRPCGALPLDNLDRRCPGRTLAQTGEYFLRKLRAKNCPQFCCLTLGGHAPWRGTSRVAEIAEKEFPVSRKASCAISCRAVSGPGRAGLGAGRSLTPRTPIPRLPALCLSGPFRSELSARSADRGRVVPVLDRSSGRSPIAPFAPSFP
jgi:hypothetical protein